MTRMIMERNAPDPPVRGRRSAGSCAACHRHGRTGGGGCCRRGGRAARVWPPMAAALAGGAMESGGRWAAGQAATGGGVLGDVEAPHVPTPPISRMGHHGTRAQPQPAGSQPTAPPAGAAADGRRHGSHDRPDSTAGPARPGAAAAGTASGHPRHRRARPAPRGAAARSEGAAV